MGQITPYIGLYIPSAGETNYEQAFASGMMNLDQHDHSGGPNKGVPITNSGLANFSVTYNKLNSNVVDPTTGVGVNGAMPNQIQILGLLQSIYKLVTTSGFITKDGATAHARTFQNTATLTWTNADGVSGNPSADVNIAGLSPVSVSNGGTGRTSLDSYSVLCGGTTNTDPVQSISGQGNAGDVFTSQGAGMLPVWSSPGSLGQIQYLSVTLTASQIRNLVGTPIQIVPAPGAGNIIVPIYCYALLNFGTTNFSSGGTPIVIAYDALSSALIFSTAALTGSVNLYAWATQTSSGSAGVTKTIVQNKALFITNFGSNYSGGGTSTVTFLIAYTINTL